MRLIFEFSGDVPALARGELRALLDSYGIGYEWMTDDSLASIVEVDRFEPAIVERCALTRSVYLHHSTVEPDLGPLVERARQLELGPGTVAVRARHLEGLNQNLRGDQVNREIGRALADRGYSVSLETPDTRVVPLIANKAHLGTLLHQNNLGAFETRKVQNRPYFSPVSLHPKTARALVNLTGVREGERLYDPFCGTGGILIEAAMVGAVPCGSDISQRMVDGTAENLEHYGIDGAELWVGDIGYGAERVGKVPAIATDPPYGRSSTTNREPMGELYLRFMEVAGRTLTDRGRLAMVVPDLHLVEDRPRNMSLEMSVESKVHRSLTRFFCLFVKH